MTFDIDANGILNVTAQDKATGKEQKVTVTASTNLNKSDIDRMVQEAQKNQAADQRLPRPGRGPQPGRQHDLLYRKAAQGKRQPAGFAAWQFGEQDR